MKPKIPLKFRTITIIVIALVVAVYSWIQPFSTTEYASLTALNAKQKIEGFVQVGRFGESWPATIVEIRVQEDRIEFTRSNGQPHIYQGFAGFRMKMIRLNSRSGAEVIVVYRSAPVDAPPKRERDDKPVIKRI